MKKKLLALVTALLVTFQPATVWAEDLMTITHEAGYTEALEMNLPKASIVIDAKTGDILWGDQIDAPRDPASMSKLLALYLVYEAMEEGKFGLDTVVTATATDEAIGKLWEISNNKIVAGVDYTVEELIIATLVPSSNVATLMLANLVEPDPDNFIDLQNAKAKELGMTNTTFYNATGAVARAFGGYYAPQRHDIYTPNTTTARDYAILTYHFVKNFSEILDYTSSKDISIKEGTPYQEDFHAYNHSLPGSKYELEGMIGLKTGSSPSAGFNITAVTKRGDQERIAIIMGVGDWADQDGEYYRHPFTNALLEKSYTDYEYKLLAEAGKHKIGDQSVVLDQPVYGTVAKGKTADLVFENNQVRVDNGLEKVSPLIAESQAVAAKKAGLFDLGSSKSTGSESGQKGKALNWLLLLSTIFGTVFLLGFVIFLLEKGSRKKGRHNRSSRHQ